MSQQWQSCSDSFRLTLAQQNDALWLTVEDTAHNKHWGCVPLLTLEVHEKAVRRNLTLVKYTVDEVTELPGGWHVTVSHRNTAVRVGLWVRIDAGELQVEYYPTETYEDNPELFRLFSVNVLAGLIKVGAGETLLLPVNTGILCDPATKPPRSDRFLMYGEQERWELLPSLPICGGMAADGGMLALVSKGDCEAEARVVTDGQGRGHVGFAFSLRRYWPDPVDIQNREIRYSLLAPGSDIVVASAKRLRHHVMHNLGKPTIAQRAQESPEVAYLLDAYIVKVFHGMEQHGYLSLGMKKTDNLSFHSYTSFIEAKEGLRKFHDAGIDKVLTQHVGWNPRGHDGLYPTRFPIEPRLGGEAGFRDMVAYGNDLGFMMNVHDNAIMGTKRSPDLNLEYITHDIYGEPLIHGWWAGGVEYSHWLASLPEERLQGHFKRVKELGIRGLYYLDYMGQPLEVNYHPKHKGPRRIFAEGIARALNAAKEVFGAVGTETGFLYAVLPVDHLASYPKPGHLNSCEPDWPIVELLDKEQIVPVWQLALHGLVVTENAQDPSWKMLMQTLLYGDHPRTEWETHAGVLPVLTDDVVRRLALVFDVALKQFKHLQTAELTNYKQLAPKVLQTTFEDGTEITADFNTDELQINGKHFARPEGL